MQPDCLAEYLRGIQDNPTPTLEDELAATALLITCMNAHLYNTLGEHLVDRSGEADVTGKAFLEVGMLTQVLAHHTDAVQQYAMRAREAHNSGTTPDQTRLYELARDLDAFVQTVLQDLQIRHHSD